MVFQKGNMYGKKNLGKKYKIKTFEHFWKKISINFNPVIWFLWDDDCWEWVGYKDSCGYGSIRFENKQYKTHRFMYILTYGSIPDGLYVCHSCDNPKCCNPKHLWLGTQLDNVNDMYSKGRDVNHCGESNGRSKLTQRDVEKIRKLYKTEKYSYRLLSKIYNVHYSTIGKIICLETWNE